MAKWAQSALVRYLVDLESLALLSREGLDLEAVPDPELREVVAWALAEYRRSGRAPSIVATKERWGELLDGREIDMDSDPEESVEAAIDNLKADWVSKITTGLAKRLVSEVAQAAEEDRVEAFLRGVNRQAEVAVRLQPRTTQVDIQAGAAQVLAEYERVKATGNPIEGLTFGMSPVDAWTRGIRPGELCIIAAPPKQGKSWALAYISYHAWLAGMPIGLYTLENTISMTLTRIAAIACGLDVLALMDGKLDSDTEDQLRTWVHDELPKSDVPLLVMNPETTMRSPGAIVQTARANGLTGLIVDQLSHLERPDLEGYRQNRPTEIKDIADGLATEIKTGRHQLSCVLAHQINRAGVEHFEKAGRLEMRHTAEGAIERAPDFLLAITQNEMQRAWNKATLQCLAVRRVPPQDFALQWLPQVGEISVLEEVAEL